MIDDIALTQSDLIDHLLDNLPSGYTKAQVKRPNVKFTTPKNDKWLRTTFINGVKDNVEAGGSYKRTYAIFIVDSFWPKGVGYKSQLNELKELQNLYENLEIGNAKCQEAEPIIIGEDGSWYHTQININLYYEGQ